jgi:hypothetical protein
MPDYKKMTLESLRELARSLLGPGHSKKTKAELVSALERGGKAAPPAPARKERAGAVGKAARAAAEKLGSAAREGVKAVKAVAGKAAPAKRPGRKAAGEGAAGPRTAAPKSRARKPAEAERAPAARHPQGPDPDGFFVARIRGEEAMREAPHPMTETAPGGGWQEAEEPRGAATYEEKLGELPWSYGDDAFVALPRDPTCLFLYWDFAGGTLSRGFEGLDHPRTQLWIHASAGAGWDRVRVVDFALESRGFYVHDLEPGRVYRAEIHVVDRAGRDRLLGVPSNECGLPPVGPSPVMDDRFIRIPWDLPLGKLLGPGHPGAPFPDDVRAMLARLSDWSRFSGPSWGGSAGGMGGRPFSPTSAPSSPGGRER